MRTNVDIDEKLIAKAMKKTGATANGLVKTSEERQRDDHDRQRHEHHQPPAASNRG